MTTSNVILQAKPSRPQRPSARFGAPLTEGIASVRGMWKDMGDSELLRKAQLKVALHGIGSPEGLQSSFRGVFVELHKRGLLDDLRYSSTHPEPAPKAIVVPASSAKVWKNLTDDEALARAQEIVARRGVSSEEELREHLRGIFVEFHQRGILSYLEYSEPAPREKPRAAPVRAMWKDLGDSELVERAQASVERNRVSGQDELQSRYPGIFVELHKRGLVEAVRYQAE